MKSLQAGFEKQYREAKGFGDNEKYQAHLECEQVGETEIRYLQPEVQMQFVFYCSGYNDALASGNFGYFFFGSFMMDSADNFWRAEMEILESEAEARRKRAELALDEMFKKGGRASFSLRNGSRICPNGSEPTEVNKPMTDDEFKTFRRWWSDKEPIPDSKTAICLPYTD